MNSLIIHYTNGIEENYVVSFDQKTEKGLQMQHFHQFISDGVLKLVDEKKHLVLIPLGNIMKIIIKPEDEINGNIYFPSFVHVQEVSKNNK